MSPNAAGFPPLFNRNIGVQNNAARRCWHQSRKYQARLDSPLERRGSHLQLSCVQSLPSDARCGLSLKLGVTLASFFRVSHHPYNAHPISHTMHSSHAFAQAPRLNSALLSHHATETVAAGTGPTDPWLFSRDTSSSATKDVRPADGHGTTKHSSMPRCRCNSQLAALASGYVENSAFFGPVRAPPPNSSWRVVSRLLPLVSRYLPWRPLVLCFPWRLLGQQGGAGGLAQLVR